MTPDGVDYDGLGRLVESQIAGGVSGLVAVGTTGECPTLDAKEHIDVIKYVIKAAASLILFVPNLVLFIILQNNVMNTMAHSGIK